MKMDLAPPGGFATGASRHGPEGDISGGDQTRLRPPLRLLAEVQDWLDAQLAEAGARGPVVSFMGSRAWRSGWAYRFRMTVPFRDRRAFDVLRHGASPAAWGPQFNRWALTSLAVGEVEDMERALSFAEVEARLMTEQLG